MKTGFLNDVLHRVRLGFTKSRSRIVTYCRLARYGIVLSGKKRLGADLLAVCGLAAIVLVFLWRGATMQGVFFGADEISSDLAHFSYPNRDFWANDYLKHNKILLWNSYTGAGMPVLGEQQTGVFYPPAVLLFYFLPVPVAFNWLIIVNFLLIAFGTYLFARSLTLNTFMAFYAALVFTFSGFMVGHLRHIPVLSAAAFGPLMFWAAERLLLSFGGKIKAENFLWAGVLSVLMAFSVFGGSLPITYIILLILAIYFALRWWFSTSAALFTRLPILIIFAGSIIFSLGLSAIQILPVLELIPNSIRDRYEFTDSISASYWPTHLIFFVAPYFFGDPSRATRALNPADNYWENIGYVGLLPLILAFWGVYKGFKNKQIVLVMAVVLGLSFLLTLGQHTFFYKLFWDMVPGFNKIRISGRFLFFVDFFLAILSGFALKFLTARMKEKQAFWIVLIVSLITLFDLFRFGFGFNTVIPASYFDTPESAKMIKEDRGLFRIQSGNQTTFWISAWEASGGWRGDLQAYFWHREIIPEDFNLTFRLASPISTQGETGHFVPERPNKLAGEIFSHHYLKTDPKFAKLLGMENVKYFIFERDYGKVEGMEFMRAFNKDEEGFTTYLYKNNKWLPRAYFVGKYAVLKPDEELTRIFAEDFEPAGEVLLEKDPHKPMSGGRGRVNISSYSDEKVVINAKAEDGGFLVLSDTFYPGWRAYTDGKETEIFRANYAYRAVYLEPGEHQAVFKYEPVSVKAGAYISILSLVFGILVLIVLRLKFR